MFKIESEVKKKTIINIDRLLSPIEAFEGLGTQETALHYKLWPLHSCSVNYLRIKTTLDNPCESWH